MRNLNKNNIKIFDKHKSVNKLMSNIPTSNIKFPTSNSAITLIALIITIIVLLILAGVTLNMVIGENGIFGKANRASEETKKNQAIETVQTSLLSARMEYTLNHNIKVKEFVEKENKKIEVEQTGNGEPLDSWEMTYDGYTFEINDLKINGISKGKNNPKVKNLVVEEGYQFATTKGKTSKVEFEVELPDELNGAKITVTSPTKENVEISEIKYENGKYVGTIKTTGQVNPNGSYQYEIKATKDGKEKTATAVANVEKFLDDPKIEIPEKNKKYNAITIKVANNYPKDAGIKYKYYVKNTTADFETSTSKEITGLTALTDYNVKVEAYLSDESDYKEVTTTITTPEKLMEIDSIEDLERISEDLASSYKLTRTLDFKDRSCYETQERYEYYNKDENGDNIPDNSWYPLGSYSGNIAFTGKLNGDYYTIKNLYGNPMFSLTKNATIENIALEKFSAINGCIAMVSNSTKFSKVKVFDSTVSPAYSGLISGTDSNGVYDQISANGDVTGSAYVGSVIGAPSNTIITNSYATGTVKLTNYNSGGACFLGYGNVKNIQNCYTISKSVYSHQYERAFILGSVTNIANCFWNRTDSNLTDGGDGTEKSQEDMKLQSTYTDAGWDFETIWEMNSETGYPKLKWENNIK